MLETSDDIAYDVEFLRAAYLDAGRLARDHVDETGFPQDDLRKSYSLFYRWFRTFIVEHVPRPSGPAVYVARWGQESGAEVLRPS